MIVGFGSFIGLCVGLFVVRGFGFVLGKFVVGIIIFFVIVCFCVLLDGGLFILVVLIGKVDEVYC